MPLTSRTVTQSLGAQLCGSLYSANPSLASSVSSAIPAATSAAAIVASEDPTDIKNYPLCAVSRPLKSKRILTEQTADVTFQQKCLAPGLASSGCGTLIHRECVCKNFASLSGVDECERQTCSAIELEGRPRPIDNNVGKVIEADIQCLQSCIQPRICALQSRRRYRQQHHRE